MLLDLANNSNILAQEIQIPELEKPIIQFLTRFTATEITGDTTTATELKSLIGTDMERLKQARGIEKVAETCELSFNCFLDWVAAGSRWVRGREVISARNQILSARGDARLCLCRAEEDSTDREDQSHHHQRHRAAPTTHL